MATSTSKASVAADAGVGRRVLAGVLGGLVGGMVFGMAMQMLGMMDVVAMLVGSQSVLVGWGVHLMISMALGVGFGLIAGRGLDVWGTGIALGVGYGMVWWVLGGLLLLPVKLGLPVFTFDTVAFESLAGHMMYGAALGAVAVAVVRSGRAHALG